MDKLLAFHTKSKYDIINIINMLVVSRVSFGRYIEYPAQRRERVAAGELNLLRIIRVTFASF